MKRQTLVALGRRISKLRKNQGYSAVKVADRCGVSRQLIYDWEAGNKAPNLDTIVVLAGMFAVSSDFLLGIPKPKDV